MRNPLFKFIFLFFFEFWIVFGILLAIAIIVGVADFVQTAGIATDNPALSSHATATKREV